MRHEPNAHFLKKYSDKIMRHNFLFLREKHVGLEPVPSPYVILYLKRAGKGDTCGF